MALIVVGGHSRSVGKTSVVAGLIAALPEFGWTAVKVTQYGHGICSADGELCDCATDDHSWAVSEERDRSGESDSSRFLVAGAKRSLWVRTRQGFLAEAMPRLREELAKAENAIVESNSIIRFVRPDLYITVLIRRRPISSSRRRTFSTALTSLFCTSMPPTLHGRMFRSDRCSTGRRSAFARRSTFPPSSRSSFASGWPQHRSAIVKPRVSPLALPACSPVYCPPPPSGCHLHRRCA